MEQKLLHIWGSRGEFSLTGFHARSTQRQWHLGSGLRLLVSHYQEAGAEGESFLLTASCPSLGFTPEGSVLPLE